MNPFLVPLSRVDEFDEIIDVRTPLEYAEDHIPGALNAPVLSNDQRVIIGTMYKQESPHEATRIGAAWVARNIATHLETTFADRPLNWRPLIYCWRGGKRSGSMTSWLNLIGWRARQLDGGYKTYRRWVVDELDALPARLRYIVLTGRTGSGKTQLLGALARAGAQTLDLERLAVHRGSLLGALPGAEQPTQKGFDTALVLALRGLDPARPVFVEAESRKIGRIALPDTILAGMREARCVAVETARDERIELLLRDYEHLFDDPVAFVQQLTRLTELHGHARIRDWQALAEAGERGELFESLIDLHYDPAYTRSSRAAFRQLADALPFPFAPMTGDADAQARALIDLIERGDERG